MRILVSIFISFLLFFAPFSFAGAEPWGFAVLQGGIGLCLACWVLGGKRWTFTPLMRPALGALVFLIGYSLLQSFSAYTLLDGRVAYPATLMRLFTLEHCSLFLTYLTAAWLLSQLGKDTQAVRRFMLLGALSGLAVGLCALCMNNGEYIYIFTGVRGGIGPFLNRNHAGVFLAMTALLTLGWTAAGFIRRTHSTGKGPFWLKQIFFSLVFIGLSVGAVFTRSRGAMLALTAGLFSFAFICTACLTKQIKKRICYLALLSALLACCIGWAYTHTEEINRFAHRAGGTSEQIRYMLYHASMDMLADYPVWGIGVGAMPVAITSYIPPTLNSYVERLHSDWLEILLGVGYAGAVPLLVLLGWFVWAAFARLRRLDSRRQLLFAALLCALEVMAVGSTVDFHFFIPANAFLFFVVLGLLCSAAFDTESAVSFHPAWIWRLGAVLVFACGCIIPWQKTAAWRLNVFGSGLKMPARITNARRALELYPAPRTALHLAVLLHNQSLKESDPFIADDLREQAHELTEQYLKKYPKDKELSHLYLLTR